MVSNIVQRPSGLAGPRASPFVDQFERQHLVVVASATFIPAPCRPPVRREMPLTKFLCARICGAMMIVARIPSFRRRRRFAAGDRI
jgi:hypothetical protein